MTDIQRWTVKEPYLRVQGQLLEGPFYDEAKKQFRFLDILDSKLHLLDLEKGPESLKTLDTGDPIGVTANLETDNLGENGRIAVGAKYGYATLDLETGKLSYLRTVWTEADGPGKAERMRFNDGAVDSRGRFWCGMMTDLKLEKLQHEGVLFRMDPDLTLHRMVEDAGILNGMGWNDDESIMYVTDSPTQNIYAYDFDVETGQISNRRVFFTVPGDGSPDGFAMDAEGCLWVAVFTGSQVLRVSPEGKIVGEVSLPAKRITCTAFAGTELFITTTRDDEVDEDLYGGNLYKVDVGVAGKPLNKFKLAAS